jgi:hypothetical protein
MSKWHFREGLEQCTYIKVNNRKILFKLKYTFCILGWVDIGTVAREPLNVVANLSKVKIRKKLFDKVIASALVTTFWVLLYSKLCIYGKIFFTIWTIWVSKDSEFYAGFKIINIP